MARRILVIDDDPILAGMLRLTLEIEGYAVSVAADGAEGIEQAKTSCFDLILLDLMMPKVDGSKFLRLLAEAEQNAPPVMVISSAYDESFAEKFSALGVVDMARKPLDPADVIERVAAIFRKAADGAAGGGAAT